MCGIDLLSDFLDNLLVAPCARKYVPACVCVRLCAADKRSLATLHSTHHVLLLKEHVHVSSTSK